MTPFHAYKTGRPLAASFHNPLCHTVTNMTNLATIKEGEEPITTENGAPMAKCDMWDSFFVYTTPGTDKDKVQSNFKVLYTADKAKAFRYAMRLGHLREGSGGSADMHNWMACMEVIWQSNPLHIISNIRYIMEDVSCKMALVLFKHVSNLESKNNNNYWENEESIIKKREYMMSYRLSKVLQKLRNTPVWDPALRDELQKMAQGAADQCQVRRKARFDAHVRVLEEFLEKEVDMPGVIDNIFQILQPKPLSLKTKTFEVRKTVTVPRYCPFSLSQGTVICFL